MMFYCSKGPYLAVKQQAKGQSHQVNEKQEGCGNQLLLCASVTDSWLLQSRGYPKILPPKKPNKQNR